METLVETLTSARKEIGEMNGDSDTADNVIEILEDAGSQLGYLQVNCCSPGRMKLYITSLDSLTKVQRGVNRAIKKGH